MITLRVDEKHLRAVLTLAYYTKDLSYDEIRSIRHVKDAVSTAILEAAERKLEMEIGAITEGVPI